MRRAGNYPHTTMAKARAGPLVQGITGSLGTVTFLAGKTGTILRTRTKPTTKRTLALETQRSKVATVTRAWDGLTDDQRLEWDAAAAALNLSSPLALPKLPNGRTLFIQQWTTHPDLLPTGYQFAPTLRRRVFWETASTFYEYATASIDLTFNPGSEMAAGIFVVYGARGYTKVGMNIKAYRRFYTDSYTTPDTIELVLPFITAFGTPQPNEIISLRVRTLEDSGCWSLPWTSTGPYTL